MKSQKCRISIEDQFKRPCSIVFDKIKRNISFKEVCAFQRKCLQRKKGGNVFKTCTQAISGKKRTWNIHSQKKWHKYFHGVSRILKYRQYCMVFFKFRLIFTARSCLASMRVVSSQAPFAKTTFRSEPWHVSRSLRSLRHAARENYAQLQMQRWILEFRDRGKLSEREHKTAH